jgi:hypothetical protein
MKMTEVEEVEHHPYETSAYLLHFDEILKCDENNSIVRLLTELDDKTR